MKKDSQIQFRLDSITKKRFKSLLLEAGDNMSEALCRAVVKLIDDLPNETELCTPMCIKLNENTQPANDDDHLDQITNLDYAPTLKTLLKELSKARHEEYACLDDECLMALYIELYQSNQLHLLFEWEHFDGRIRDEWSGDA
jgi:hypothetical protein